MLALHKFETEWMNHHFPTMDLTAEIPFYYGIYQQIATIVEQKRPLKSNDDWYIIQMLMYVEDAAHLGLCLVYAKKYRMVEDMIGHWAEIMQLSADQIRIRLHLQVEFAMFLVQKKNKKNQPDRAKYEIKQNFSFYHNELVD